MEALKIENKIEDNFKGKIKTEDKGKKIRSVKKTIGSKLNTSRKDKSCRKITFKYDFKDVFELKALTEDNLKEQIKRFSELSIDLDEEKAIDLLTGCPFKLDVRYIEIFIRDQIRLIQGEVEQIGRKIEKSVISRGRLVQKVFDDLKEERYIDRLLWEEILEGEDVLQSIRTPAELEAWKEICLARLEFCLRFPEYKTKLLKTVWFK